MTDVPDATATSPASSPAPAIDWTGPWHVRFAPSPTGSLHIGNARTAILNWLVAKSSGGTFQLRIEDTDQERSSFASMAEILDALARLGVEPDAPFVRQSLRLGRYGEIAARLQTTMNAYPCFCSEEELEAERKACEAEGRPPRYSGKCANMASEHVFPLIASEAPRALRFKAPEGLTQVRFLDQVKGEIVVPAEAFGDFVIMRSNGWPSYNFAAVVDDIDMRVNLVLRGEDHLTNTARQILIYQALGATPPRFAHHGLLMDSERRKLSKRSGAVSAREALDSGILPAALRHYLAGLSGAIPHDAGIVADPQALAKAFQPERIGGSGVVFQPEELDRLNQDYLRALPPSELLRRFDARSLPSVAQTAWAEMDETARVMALVLVQHAAHSLAELPRMVAPLLRAPLEYAHEAAAELAERQPATVAVLEACLDELGRTPAYEEPLTAAGADALVQAVQEKTGTKGKALWRPLRLALTGAAAGPEVKTILTFLPPSVLSARLEFALFLAGKSPSR